MAPRELQGLELCPLWPHLGTSFPERLCCPERAARPPGQTRETFWKRQHKRRHTKAEVIAVGAGGEWMKVE